MGWGDWVEFYKHLHMNVPGRLGLGTCVLPTRIQHHTQTHTHTGDTPGSIHDGYLLGLLALSLLPNISKYKIHEHSGSEEPGLNK